MIEPRVDDFLDSLQPIASEMSPAIVMDLVAHFAGRRLYVPKQWRADLDLNVLGEENARRLCELFGPERIDIARSPFTRRALQRFAKDLSGEGLRTGEIAHRLGVSYRTIERFATGPILTKSRRRRVDERQIDIVDWLSAAKG